MMAVRRLPIANCEDLWEHGRRCENTVVLKPTPVHVRHEFCTWSWWFKLHAPNSIHGLTENEISPNIWKSRICQSVAELFHAMTCDAYKKQIPYHGLLCVIQQRNIRGAFFTRVYHNLKIVLRYFKNQLNTYCLLNNYFQLFYWTTKPNISKHGVKAKNPRYPGLDAQIL